MEMRCLAFALEEAAHITRVESKTGEWWSFSMCVKEPLWDARAELKFDKQRAWGNAVSVSGLVEPKTKPWLNDEIRYTLSAARDGSQPGITIEGRPAFVVEVQIRSAADEVYGDVIAGGGKSGMRSASPYAFKYDAKAADRYASDVATKLHGAGTTKDKDLLALVEGGNLMAIKKEKTFS